jgi:hypothetical protein
MAKNFFLIVDTETTQDEKVADFGAVVCDKKGNIVAQCGVLVKDIFDNPSEHPLFFDSKQPAGALWSRSDADRRYKMYTEMLNGGSRMLASVAAINRWLARVNVQYNSPILTAYNKSFDVGKCRNTDIDLDMFQRQFCLWYAAYTIFAHTAKYREAVLALHAFNNPTVLGNMTFKTNAETMARFLTGNLEMLDEPHTALEDAKDYELPILVACLKKWSVRKLLTETKPYVWKDCQVKDWFTASK